MNENISNSTNVETQPSHTEIVNQVNAANEEAKAWAKQVSQEATHDQTEATGEAATETAEEAASTLCEDQDATETAPEDGKTVAVVGEAGPEFHAPTEEDVQLRDDKANKLDFEAFITLPFIELYNRLAKVRSDRADIESTKAMMDQIGDLSKDPNSAKINMMAVEQLHQSAQEFYEKYPVVIHDALRTEDLLDKMLSLFPENYTNSTEFISQSMLEASDLRRDTMQQEGATLGPNHHLVMKRLDVVEGSYRNRVDFSVLFNKLRYPNNTYKIYEEFMKVGPDGAMAYVNKIFMPVFNDSNMSRFRAAFIDLSVRQHKDDPVTPNAEVMTFFMTFWLAKMYEREFKSGKCSYVKTFVMNFYDMRAGIFDCPGGVELGSAIGNTIFVILTATVAVPRKKKELQNDVVPLVDSLVNVLNDQYGQFINGDAMKEKMCERTSLATIIPDLTYEKMLEMIALAPVDETAGAAAEGTDDTDATPADGDSSDITDAEIPVEHNEVETQKPIARGATAKVVN